MTTTTEVATFDHDLPGYPMLLPNGVLLRRWVDSEGSGWACAATDHGDGSLCCRCQRIDDPFIDTLLHHAADGLALLRADPDGHFQFTPVAETNGGRRS